MTCVWVSKVIDVNGNVTNPNEEIFRGYTLLADGSFTCDVESNPYLISVVGNLPKEVYQISYVSAGPILIIKLPISNDKVNYYLQQNTESKSMRKLIVVDGKSTSIIDFIGYIKTFNTYNNLLYDLAYIHRGGLIFDYELINGILPNI